ncbi:CFI-box-CTERM domain-containing protein [Pelosinus sp. UFO1]|uniref:CFI-box-CTERM domain-containing protein n=1 Tax=Pelosinus sp. UFO1 TaxID=484770 RepID=UPI0004D129B3|nr:CFI-box-CTERM domain-containing protein [Pelosinus sp. UFO1]AIF51643.1 hypothetical protein UFO1_2096 [Pelosinus sp. UFO1]
MRQVSATELAKMGKCERQVYLDHHYGEDTSLTATYIEKGNYEHEKFNRQLSGKDKRCFIATAVFGIDAVETNILRQIRDERLIPNKPGKFFTSLYYCISPYIVILIEKYPILMIPIRITLRWFIRSWR